MKNVPNIVTLNSDYKIVPHKDRLNYKYPIDCTVLWMGCGFGWQLSTTNSDWTSDNLNFAVPSDYIFAEDKQTKSLTDREKNIIHAAIKLSMVNTSIGYVPDYELLHPTQDLQMETMREIRDIIQTSGIR